jgi:ParB-like chromosome segregation protein Spo0J
LSGDGYGAFSHTLRIQAEVVKMVRRAHGAAPKPVTYRWGDHENQKRTSAPDIRDVNINRVRSLPNREIIEEAVIDIADSIARIGMQNPLSLRRIDDPQYDYEVIAGHHRFAACRRLGIQTVSARIFSGLNAKLQRHSENLHRVEQTLLEKYEAMAGYRNAVAKAKLKCIPGGVQPHDKGISKTARKYKTNRKKVLAAMAASKLKPEIKKAIAANGFANNASLIGRLAEIEAPEEQMRELLRSKRGAGVASKPIKTSKAVEANFAALLAGWERAPICRLWKAAAPLERRKFIDHLSCGLEDDDNEWE